MAWQVPYIQDRHSKERRERFFGEVSDAISDISLNDESGTVTLILSGSKTAKEVQQVLEEQLKIFTTIINEESLLVDRPFDVRVVMNALFTPDFAPAEGWKEILNRPPVDTPLFGPGGVRDSEKEVVSKDITPEIVEELRQATKSFLSGEDESSSELFDSNQTPSMRQFTRRYEWYGDGFIDLKTGKKTTREEYHQFIYETGQMQEGPERNKRKEEILRMTFGLVIRQLKIFRKIYPFSALGSADDLVQEALVGLSRAIDLYDISKGAFSTHAISWITSRMLRAKDLTRPFFHVPVFIQHKIFKYRRAQRYYARLSQEERAQISEDAYVAREIGILLEQLPKWRKKYLVYESSLSDDIGVPFDAGLVHEEDLVSSGYVVANTLEDDLLRDKEHRTLVAHILEKSNLPPSYEVLMRLRFGIVRDEAYSGAELRDIFSSRSEAMSKTAWEFLCLSAEEQKARANFPSNMLPELESLSVRSLMFLMGLCDERAILETHEDVAKVRFISLSHIGELFGITRERVRQIEEKTLARLLETYHTKKIRLSKSETGVSPLTGSPMLGRDFFIEAGQKKLESAERRNLKTLIALLEAYAGYRDGMIASVLMSHTNKPYGEGDIKALRSEMKGENQEEKNQEFLLYYAPESREASIVFVQHYPFLPEWAKKQITESIEKRRGNAYDKEKEEKREAAGVVKERVDKRKWSEDEMECVRGLYWYCRFTSVQIARFLEEFLLVQISTKELKKYFNESGILNDKPMFNIHEFTLFVESTYGVNLSHREKRERAENKKWTEQDHQIIAGLMMYTSLQRKHIAAIISLLRGRSETTQNVSQRVQMAGGANAFVTQFAPKNSKAFRELFVSLFEEDLETVVGRVVTRI